MCAYCIELVEDNNKGYYLDLSKDFKYIYSISSGSIVPDSFVYTVYHPISSVKITPDNVYVVAFELIKKACTYYEDSDILCTFEIVVIGKWGKNDTCYIR